MTNEERLDSEITRLASQLPTIDDIEDYTKAVGNISALINVKEKLYPKEVVQEPWYIRVLTNPATWGIVSNVAISGAVLHHEKVNTITSKAFGFVRTR